LSAKEVRRLVLDQIQSLDGNIHTVSSPLEETEPV
jgi:hypothetical protein